MFKTLTITRHADNQTITVPVVTGLAPAEISGQWIMVDVPCLDQDADDTARAFLGGTNIEQHMQYLYIDGNGITSFDGLEWGSDYSYTLA